MNCRLKNLRNGLILCLFVSAFGTAQAQDDPESDVFEMSLEDLLSMEVTSVSKKAERLQDVASSIYVVSSEELLKSGATTLHEILRQIPGYWGVQSQYNDVNYSVRNSPTENGSRGTVLFLLDGTPIQDLMFSTFSFRNFDIPLDEIDRIEVIRGSGGTVYGANSATGVINIFTKDPTKYDGINVRAEGATPGYSAVSVRAGGSLSDDLSISGYGKFRYFSGFESMAGKDQDGNPLESPSRFTEDFDQSTMYSAGLKAAYALNDRSRLSFNTHFNSLQKFDYTNHFPEDFAFTGQDAIFENDYTATRFVGNLRYDMDFSDSHSLFARVSTNAENDFLRPGSGYKVSNSIIDFEIQDNLSIGSMNDLSIGANYRLVNFDVHDINDINTVNYVDPQANESLLGAFVQDKVKLIDGKLNFLLGMKMENYSLVNDEFYFSPMAKVSFIPTENLTLWGGFTQSFTTPGFNNTNVDYYIFQAPTAAQWTAAATAGVYDAVYGDTYSTAIADGADETTADAIATTAATNFVSSDLGQGIIDAEATQLRQDNPNVAVKNGSQTVPTKFRTWELGFRTTFAGKVSLESNLYYTQVSDAIGISPDEVARYEESITQPGRYAQYYLYGNYQQGTSLGSESMIRYTPVTGVVLEFSHSYLKSEWELQENDDFDISRGQTDLTPQTPHIPEHILRFKGSFDLPKEFNISASVIHGTKFSTQADYIFEMERYENLVIGEEGTNLAAEDDSRTIISFRVEKKLFNKLAIYGFGNDVTNPGRVVETDNISNVTLSQIGAMYGLGANFKF